MRSGRIESGAAPTRRVRRSGLTPDAALAERLQTRLALRAARDARRAVRLPDLPHLHRARRRRRSAASIRWRARSPPASPRRASRCSAATSASSSTSARRRAEERAFLEGLGHGRDQRQHALHGAAARTAPTRRWSRLKAVDGAYPLYGALVTEPALPRDDLFGERDGVFGAAAPDLLFERLGIKLGDAHQARHARPSSCAPRSSREPDAALRRLRLRAAADGVAGCACARPAWSSRAAWSSMPTRCRLPTAADRGRARPPSASGPSENFPQAGWSIRTAHNAAPSLSANIERFSQFLTLVGLTALVVGGVGVANAVRAYLDGKRGVIATFKCLGASGGFVFTRLSHPDPDHRRHRHRDRAGARRADAVRGAVRRLPRSSRCRPRPASIRRRSAWRRCSACWSTLAFALLPLGRARDVPATALFREMGFEAGGCRAGPMSMRRVGIARRAGAARHLVLRRPAHRARSSSARSVFAFIVLRGVGQLVQWLARQEPARALDGAAARDRQYPSARRADAVGRAVARARADAAGHAGADRRQSAPADFRQPAGARAELLLRRHPEQPRSTRFATFIARTAPDGELMRVPMLRGRIVALNGVDVQKVKVPPEGAWVLRGDRGITYAENAAGKRHAGRRRMVAGGLCRRAAGLLLGRGSAARLGLKIGDTVTVNVLGRNITARIANLRKVEWESMGINFVMVFSPNTFAGAPHSLAGDADDAGRDAGRRSARCSTPSPAPFRRSPRVRVKDALDVVNRIVGAARHGDPRRGQRRADRLGAGARRRARRRQPRPHPRCGRAEDARRDAHGR